MATSRRHHFHGICAPHPCPHQGHTGEESALINRTPKPSKTCDLSSEWPPKGKWTECQEKVDRAHSLLARSCIHEFVACDDQFNLFQRCAIVVVLHNANHRANSPATTELETPQVQPPREVRAENLLANTSAAIETLITHAKLQSSHGEVAHSGVCRFFF